MPQRHEHGSPRVLVVHDGSAEADAAVELTAAAFPGAQTTLLSVSLPEGADVPQAIVEAAARERADLIVTGLRGLADHRPWSRGSVLEEVVRQADRPVLVVPTAGPATELPAGVASRVVPNGGMRVQVVPLEDV